MPPTETVVTPEWLHEHLGRVFVAKTNRGPRMMLTSVDPGKNLIRFRTRQGGAVHTSFEELDTAMRSGALVVTRRTWA